MCMQAREGQKRERERIPRRLCAVSTDPNMGVHPINCEVMTWAKTKSQTLNWLSPPGAPEKFKFLSMGVETVLSYLTKLSLVEYSRTTL